jgi:hypothetical protein
VPSWQAVPQVEKEAPPGLRSLVWMRLVVGLEFRLASTFLLRPPAVMRNW